MNGIHKQMKKKSRREIITQKINIANLINTPTHKNYTKNIQREKKRVKNFFKEKPGRGEN